jgi:Raf kinase inhibitor-like YbhB/YbcL family protein
MNRFKEARGMKTGMFFRIFVFICVLFLAGFLFAGSAFGLELWSTAFKNGEFIPARYTGRGEDVSPSLSWSGAPKETRSFVLIMDDPDAPMGTWVHWVVYNIPANIRRLEENVPPKAVLDNATTQGVTSFRRIGYGGPNPPPGPAHRYFFKLYAIDIKLDLPPGAIKSVVIRAIKGHVLEEAQLEGLFKR